MNLKSNVKMVLLLEIGCRGTRKGKLKGFEGLREQVNLR